MSSQAWSLSSQPSSLGVGHSSTGAYVDTTTVSSPIQIGYRTLARPPDLSPRHFASRQFAIDFRVRAERGSDVVGYVWRQAEEAPGARTVVLPQLGAKDVHVNTHGIDRCFWAYSSAAALVGTKPAGYR